MEHDGSLLSQASSEAAEADEQEARGAFGVAKTRHLEAARLFRVSASKVGDEAQQHQLRALARHHDARAKWCETAEAAKV
jgi:hypothetical protein